MCCLHDSTLAPIGRAQRVAPLALRPLLPSLSETRMQRAEERGQFWDVSVG